MATLGDFIALLATLAVFGGVIYGVLYVMGSISEGVKSTKDKLKEKGLDISDKGVSVKTTKRLNREDYVDATQRGLIRAMEASTFGAQGSNGSSSNANAALSAPPLKHTVSSGSTSGNKRSLFSKKKHD